MKTLRIAMAQMNPVVGDVAGNRKRIVSLIREASAREADVVVFPELGLSGYPPEDLVLRKDFVAANRTELEAIACYTRGRDILVIAGFVDQSSGTRNGAAVILDGAVRDVYHKIHLPNYGVFDEKRYFVPGQRCPVYRFRGTRIGLNICEDIWFVQGPAYHQALGGGASIILNLNASPYHVGKWREREAMLSRRARETHAFLFYVNCVGGQDELVFDGGSMAFDPEGRLFARAALFEERLVVVDVDGPRITGRHQGPAPAPEEGEIPRTDTRIDAIELDASELRERDSRVSHMEEAPGKVEEEIWGALVTGTRDYVRKNGFEEVIVGLSGGIDSAVVAAVAADALGPDKVLCLSMPSRYTCDESRTDAAALAGNLEIPLEEVSIDEIFQSYLDRLAPAFKGKAPDITEENIQARIRGNLLMAYSNKFNRLVLTTGNKSEYSTGYATLYGDMSGGYAVLMDVLKTMVYRLAEYRNDPAIVIPENILQKAPTAELKPNQTDQDSLPPYPVLDAILHRYVEEDASPDELVAKGHDAQTVHKVLRMVDAAEFKRRQAPPGLKITKRAFGRDRRMPITNRYRRR